MGQSVSFWLATFDIIVRTNVVDIFIQDLKIPIEGFDECSDCFRGKLFFVMFYQRVDPFQQVIINIFKSWVIEFIKRHSFIKALI